MNAGDVIAEWVERKTTTPTKERNMIMTTSIYAELNYLL